ncbi:MAG TPA: hypothetical protein VI146_00480 [Nitrososphaeraceae archaeon]
MEKSNGTMIGVVVLTFTIITYSIYFNQNVLAEGQELKSVGKGTISCDGEKEIKDVRINFFVSYDKGTSFAEWNIDHPKLGSAGGIISNIRTSSDSFLLKGVEAFDNICNIETPSDISLSGSCGSGTVKLVFDNGNKGSFSSDVKCG